MATAAHKKWKWIRKKWRNGHGIYTELADEDDFFKVSKKSPNMVVHFYHDSIERCRIFDMHLRRLARKHMEAKFCRVNAEKAPFLIERLRMTTLPTILLVKNGKTKDFIVGFSDLGDCDDFPTELLEWRIAKSAVIKYEGDLWTPPAVTKKMPALPTVAEADNENDTEDEAYLPAVAETPNKNDIQVEAQLEPKS